MFCFLFFTVKEYDLMLTEDDFRQKLREEFMKNKHVTDIRVIDKLVIKVCIIKIYRKKENMEVSCFLLKKILVHFVQICYFIFLSSLLTLFTYYIF